MLLEVAHAGAADGVQLSARRTRVIQHAEQSVGRRAGVLYLANTVGAVAGQPRRRLRAAAVARLADEHDGPDASPPGLRLVPLYLATIRSVRIRRSASPILIPASIAVAALAAWLLLPVRLHQRARAAEAGTGTSACSIRAKASTRSSRSRRPSGKGRRLMTNGHAMSATWPLSQRYMRALAHVPLLMMRRPGSRASVIGFGVGNTTAAATLHPSMQRVEVADLSRNVLESRVLVQRAPTATCSAIRSVSVYVNDGRHHLLMQPAGVMRSHRARAAADWLCRRGGALLGGVLPARAHAAEAERVRQPVAAGLPGADRRRRCR